MRSTSRDISVTSPREPTEGRIGCDFGSDCCHRMIDSSRFQPVSDEHRGCARRLGDMVNDFEDLATSRDVVYDDHHVDLEVDVWLTSARSATASSLSPSMSACALWPVPRPTESRATGPARRRRPVAQVGCRPTDAAALRTTPPRSAAAEATSRTAPARTDRNEVRGVPPARKLANATNRRLPL
jgi:hypothetical protein